jgi:hypothetical protein
MGFSLIYDMLLGFYFKENSFDFFYILLDMEIASPFITTFIGEVSNRFIFFLRRRKSSSKLKLTRRTVRVYDNKLNKLITLRMLKLAAN